MSLHFILRLSVSGVMPMYVAVSAMVRCGEPRRRFVVSRIRAPSSAGNLGGFWPFFVTAAMMTGSTASGEA